jgi:hypothetical protein
VRVRNGLAAILLLAVAATAGGQGAAGGDVSSETHPDVYFVDADGNDILTSGGPVSCSVTCGLCHDVDFISSHSYHASVGLDEMFAPGSVPNVRPWDLSPGSFGRWEPLIYRYLTPRKTDLPDLGTPGWVLALGFRHAGGGPAELSRTGEPLTSLAPDAGDPETYVLDDSTGSTTAWSWRESGPVEFNCFMCHIPRPNNDARMDALRAGAFEWASTATLEGTGLVSRESDGWRWSPEAFDEDGVPGGDLFRLMAPSSRHCGQCHGMVQSGDDPVVARYGDASSWTTETQGLIFSAQLLLRSGMNIEDKRELGFPWDVHAEWLLKCTDCHFCLNDPAFAPKGTASGEKPDKGGLSHDDFVTSPDHNFAKGRSAQGTVADSLDGTMRGCDECHNVESSHGWLPYRGRHMDRLLCETCHVPAVRAPARRATDWTVLTKDRKPRVEYRGVDGDVGDPTALVEGYRPALLPREPADGENFRLAPHNLISSWFWIYGDPPVPVRLYDLERAYFEDGEYRPDILGVLDADGSGDVETSELLLDTADKVAAVRKRLASIGLKDPRISGEIQPYSISHGVTRDRWVTRRCSTCHMRPSAATRPFVLAAAVPGGVIPEPVGDANVLMNGLLSMNESGLTYTPVTRQSGFYILGHDRWIFIDRTGAVVYAIALLAVLIHGSLRFIAWRRRRSRS